MAKKNIVPLTDEERLSWNSHKVMFKAFARGSMLMLVALTDVEDRELYREEYGAITFDEFLDKAPWFNGREVSRQQKARFKAAMPIARKIAEKIGKDALENWHEKAIRALRTIVTDPVMQIEVAALLEAEEMQPTEDNIDRAHLRIVQIKETELAQQKKDGIDLKLVADDDEEEEHEEEQEEEAIQQTETEEAIIHAAEQVKKPTDYIRRGADYVRLAGKNLAKAPDEELDDADIEGALREAWEALRPIMKKLLARYAEREKVKMGKVS